jgi:hypothetical protein
MFNDIQAIKWLLTRSPHALDGDRATLCRDLTVHDTLSFLSYYSAGWNMQTATYKGAIGTMLMFAPGEGLATIMHMEDWAQKLESAGNVFRIKPHSSSNTLRLPPDTRMSLGSDGSIYVATPYVWITIRVQDSGSSLFVNPATRTPELMPDGKPRHETRNLRIEFTATYSALHSQSPGMKQSREWVARLQRASMLWFETPARDALNVLDPDGAQLNP